MKLRFTPRALTELDAILTHIERRAPSGARNVQRRIRAMLDLLVSYPGSGSPTTIPKLRRLVVTPYPYLVFYQVTEDAVIVIGVRHAAQDPATMPG